MSPNPAFVSEIYHLATDLPPEVVEKLAACLRQLSPASWLDIRAQTGQVVSQPGVRQRVRHFLDFWQSHAANIEPASVALALEAAAHAAAQQRQIQSLELVWTGPDSQVIPLRRTDQALLQLIHEAGQQLHLVSFAVYKPKAITQALVRAAQRGVTIAIYLETPDASEGKITFDTIKSLGHEIARHARLYIWPLAQGPNPKMANTVPSTPKSPSRTARPCSFPAPT